MLGLLTSTPVGDVSYETGLLPLPSYLRQDWQAVIERCVRRCCVCVCVTLFLLFSFGALPCTLLLSASWCNNVCVGDVRCGCVCVRRDAALPPIRRPLSHAYQQSVPVMYSKRSNRYALAKLGEPADVLAANLSMACVEANVMAPDDVFCPSSDCAAGMRAGDSAAPVRPLTRAILSSGLHARYATLLLHQACDLCFYSCR